MKIKALVFVLVLLLGTGYAGAQVYGGVVGPIEAGKVIYRPQTLTIPDSGDEEVAEDSTTVITASSLRIVCEDEDNCRVTLSEAGAVDGQQLSVFNAGDESVSIMGLDDVVILCDGGTGQEIAGFNSGGFEYVAGAWRQTNCD